MKPAEIHELEQRMDVLAHEYGATHDPKILAELKELSRRLRQFEDRSDAAIQRLLH